MDAMGDDDGNAGQDAQELPVLFGKEENRSGFRRKDNAPEKRKTTNGRTICKIGRSAGKRWE
jgi:hypothetical protein